MEDTYELAVSGLLRRRAALVGEIDQTRDRLTQIMADLDHLDATVRLLAPGAAIDFNRSKRPPPMFAGFRGELSRFLLDTLRIGDSFTTHEMTEKVMLARRLDPTNASDFLIMGRRVRGSLASLERVHDNVRSAKEPPTGMRRWWVEGGKHVDI